MTENDVKIELGLHLAKAILAQAAVTREVVSRTVVSLCSIGIPAHLALLNLFGTKLVGHPLPYRIAPILFWFVALLLSVAILFPKPMRVDLKQPAVLIEENGRRSRHARIVGLVAFIFSLIGLAWMTVLFAAV